MYSKQKNLKGLHHSNKMWSIKNLAMLKCKSRTSLWLFICCKTKFKKKFFWKKYFCFFTKCTLFAEKNLFIWKKSFIMKKFFTEKNFFYREKYK